VLGAGGFYFGSWLGRVRAQRDFHVPTFPTSAQQRCYCLTRRRARACCSHRCLQLYDDTSDELNRQYAGSARLPSWMQGRLSEGELGA